MAKCVALFLKSEKDLKTATYVITSMGLFTKKTTLVVKQLDYTKPFVIINFKTYIDATGANAVKLAKICERVQDKTKINIIISVQAIDLKEIASTVKIPVYSQHVDPLTAGKTTGGIIPEHLSTINIHGSLINHSEKRILLKDIKAIVLKLRELNMKSVVCAKDYKEAAVFAKMQPVKPDFIAIEPPELIGGEKSVSTAKPEIIPKAVKACGGINVLVGAGIKDANDLKVALVHGAKGVLLASHFVLSKDPEKFLMDLVQGV